MAATMTSMKKVLIVPLVLAGAVLLAFTYEQVFVDKSIGGKATFGFVLLGIQFLVLLVSYLLSATRYAQVVVHAWLIALSIAVTYLIVDLGAGYLLIKPLSPPIVPDQYRHHKLVPNTSAQFAQREFNYVQRVNNLGLRGHDRSLDKPAGTTRSLMLGASFNMGKGVQDDETFSVLLEAALNRQSAACDGKPIEVLNAGVDSYSPILSYIQFKRELLPLGADVVVLNLDMSDLEQEDAYRKDAQFSEDGEPLAVPQRAMEQLSFRERMGVWLEKNMYLTRWLLYHADRLLDRDEVAPGEVLTRATMKLMAHTLAEDTVERDEQWTRLFDSIRRLKELAEQNSAEFLLSIYPWGHQVDDNEWIPGRYHFIPEDATVSDASVERIATIAADNQILMINHFPLFRSFAGARQMFFRHDMHFTPVGHQVMADGLWRFLSDNQLERLCAPTWSQSNTCDVDSPNEQCQVLGAVAMDQAHD